MVELAGRAPRRGGESAIEGLFQVLLLVGVLPASSAAAFLRESGFRGSFRRYDEGRPT